MLDYDWNYIPLSLVINENITTYIIDNTLLGSIHSSSFGHSPYRAFSLLLQLFNNDLTRDVFPKQLSDVLGNDCNIPTGINKELLVGDCDQGMCHYALNVDMIISEDIKLPVHFTNFQYNHRASYKILNRSISISSKQAFYLLGNILLNNRYHIFDYHFTIHEIMDKTLVEYTEFIDETNPRNGSRYYDIYRLLNQYSFVYIQYLYSKLIAGLLSPAALLCYNGATTLAFLRSIPPVEKYIVDIISSLKGTPPKTFNQQVLYYTLLYSSFNYKNAEDIVYKFLEDQSDKSKNLYVKTIAKGFPESDRIVYNFE
ncbi:MAG: hypothetical protein FK733_14445 [Asgard group archaeon]|nr:hypothetical protein [Asgard group archaeon]